MLSKHLFVIQKFRLIGSTSFGFYRVPRGSVVKCLDKELLTLSQTTKFRLFQTERVCTASDTFKLNENGRKLSKRVKNSVGKGEIARYDQFLLFRQCFQKPCTADK